MLNTVTRLAWACLLVLVASRATSLPGLVARNEPPPTNTTVCDVRHNTIPEGQICNFNGHLKNPARPILLERGLTFEQCRDACLARFTCESFGFNSRGNVCRLLPRFISEQGRKGKGGPITFWDSDCYTAYRSREHSILDAGFETGQLGPNWFKEYDPASPNSTVKVVRRGQNSRHAALMSVDNTGNSTDENFKAYLAQGFQVCKGFQYSFSFNFLQVPGETDVSPNNSCKSTLKASFTTLSGRVEMENRFYLGEDLFFFHEHSHVAGYYYGFEFNYVPTTSGFHGIQFELSVCPGGASVIKLDNIHVDTQNKPLS